MPDCGLAEILGSRVDARGDEIASVDVLLLHAARTLFKTGDALSLEPAGFALLFCLSALKGCVFSGLVSAGPLLTAGREAKECKIGSGALAARGAVLVIGMASRRRMRRGAGAGGLDLQTTGMAGGGACLLCLGVAHGDGG